MKSRIQRNFMYFLFCIIIFAIALPELSMSLAEMIGMAFAVAVLSLILYKLFIS